MPVKSVPLENEKSDHKTEENNWSVPGDSGSKSQYLRLIRACICEFIGVFIFVFVGSLSAAVSSENNIVGIAFTHGLCIAVLICCIGHISGGHLNPAVTLGILITRDIPVISALAYMISQLFGGFMGALVLWAVLPDKMYNTTLAGITGIPFNAEYPLQPLTAEIVFTYFLVSTVLMTAVDQENFTLAPLAIGLSIVVDILAGGGVSGASMNPARSFGPVLVYCMFGLHDGWTLHWIDWVGPTIGSVIAGLIYKAFFAKDGKRWLL